MYQDVDYSKNTKLNYFELLFIVYSFFQMFLFEWLWNKNFYHYVFMIYVVYFTVILFSKKKIKYGYKSIGFLVIFFNVFIVFLNIYENGISSDLFKNVFNVYGNIFIIIFFGYIIKYKRKALEDFIVKYLAPFLNLYFFINIPIIVKQIEGNGFMMKFTEGNPLYFDQITGLIGANGTHRMTFYWIALTLININIYQKYKKKFMLYMAIAEIIFMVVISSYCDNTAFYYFFPVILVQFFMKELLKINIKNFVKFMSIIIIITIFGIYLFKNNESVNEFYNSRIKEKYEQFTGKSGGQNDEERIVLFKYALDYGNGYKFGSGIGSATYGDSMLPQHFGMSEISILTYQGGIIYLVSIIFLYAYYSIKLINVSTNLRIGRFLIYIIMVINYMIMSIYTQVFITFEMIFMVSIILSIFNFKYNRNIEEKHGEAQGEINLYNSL